MSTNPLHLIGSGPTMGALRRLIATVARSQATVLITGESGTGKELIARALHEASERRLGRFVAINCGAIPRELIESELFGHRKGAFTGAVVDRIGRFEQAHGGTIFLDEIGDLPLDMQVKLLRVLQERMVDPVGSVQSTRIDVRVVAATHRDLEAEVLAGRFREDLYYRLNVLPLASPALRERAEDVPELLVHHASRLAPEGCAPITFDQPTVEALSAYAWPGNVRELSNLVDRFTTLFSGRCVSLRDIPLPMLPKGLHAAQEAMALQAHTTPTVYNLMSPAGHAAGETAEPESAHGAADAAHPAELSSQVATDVEQSILMAQGGPTVVLPPEGLSLKDHLAETERSLLEQALARSGGNVSQTARLLQLQRTTLIEKLNKYAMRAA
ncbi:MAG: sigma-54 interaction domain-containing protein [Betaproteobacteria bacterium]